MFRYKELKVKPKEVELERLKFKKHQLEIKNKQEQQITLELRKNEFREKGISKAIIVFFFLYILAFFISFQDENYLSMGIALLQIVFCGYAWLDGLEYVRKGKNKYYGLLFAISLGLMFPYLDPPDLDFQNIDSENEDFYWPAAIYAEKLPDPGATGGKYRINSDNEVDAEIHKYSLKKFHDYKNKCIEKGFIIDGINETNSYKAFNEEGFYLEIAFHDYSNEMDINLKRPVKNEIINWDNAILALKIPKLNSDTGEIIRNDENYLHVYVTNTSFDTYNTYVSDCIEKGFKKDTFKTDTIYRAYNSKKYEVRIQYMGFNTIDLIVDAPSKE